MSSARAIFRDVLCLIFLIAAVGSPALAQSDPLPKGNFTIVVPLTAGGPADVIARAIGQQLSKRIDRTVLIENKTGAGGNIGAAAVASAEPNGLTWLFTVDSVFTSNPHIFEKQGFDATKDIVPVTGIGRVVLLLAVNARNVPAKSWPELVEFSKTRPLNFASGGIGTPGHLAFIYLQSVSDVKGTHVPYRGAAPAVQDLISGVVEAGFVTSGALVPHVKSGVLRAIAVSSDTRVSAFPDVPTAKEAGIANFAAQFTTMMFTQANVPDEIRAYVGGHLRAIANSPQLRETLHRLSMEPYVADEEEAKSWIATERERWGKVIKAAGLPLR
ncbi:MAG: tripartite tricarboxylate transporter substrate binding protein [Proteobacteria bacterium]|nr:tripartite tricarboxylate transporter substrate binding protein [Pseudomonadota bacterium]